MSRTISTADKKPNEMTRFYSRKYGLANSFKEISMNHLSVSTEGYSIAIGNVIPMWNTVIGNARVGLWEGGAVALNRERSRVKAVGEFVERYCATCDGSLHVKKMIFDSFDNLNEKGVHCLDQHDLIHFEDRLYEDPEFPLSRYFSNLPISWVEGENLISGNRVLLPAQKVFLSYPLQNMEQFHLWGLSTGLACGMDFSQAVLNAVCEVIERDSFMLTWRLKISGKRIEVTNVRNEELIALYSHILKHLVGEDELHIYDISKTVGVHTILSFIRNNLPDAFGLIVATASHPNPEIALLKSLEELCQTQVFAYSSLIKDRERECQRMKEQDITELKKHTLYYSTGRNSRNIDFISNSGENIRLCDMADYSHGSDKESLKYLINQFKSKKQRVFIADITKPEIREEGLCVIKAIIPGYVDLDANNRFKQLKSSRLRMYQKQYDVEINYAPHPFP